MKKELTLFWNIINDHAQPIFFMLICGLLLGMVFVIGLDRPFWGDEEHFIATIRYFGENFSLDKFADYDEVIGPFVFILYALWGKIVNFEISHLRLLSLLSAVATFMLIFRLYAAILPRPKVAFITGCLLLLNPYIWALSFFVFTDIPTLCFLILMSWAVYRKRPLLLLMATAAALLSRQYTVYLAVAAGLYQTISYYRGEKTQLFNLSALALGFIPLLMFILLWGGIAPPSGIKRWVVPDGRFYHYSYITTYITFMAIYLLPSIIIMRRLLFRQRAKMVAAFLLSGWYWFFPVRPSSVALVQTEYDTVGLMHRLIKFIIKVPLLEDAVLWGLFWCGLVLLATIIMQDIKRFRYGVWDYGHFLTIVVVCFLLIMPFSYQVWEKYLVMVLPFLLLRSMLLSESPDRRGAESFS